MNILAYLILPLLVLFTQGEQKPHRVKARDGSNSIYIYYGNGGSPVRMPGLVPGAHIYVEMVSPEDYIEASRERMIVVLPDPKGGTTTQVAGDLNALRGSVKITSKAAALRYVRLLTTPKTYYLWPVHAVEVVSRSDAHSLPDFGVASSWGFRAVDSGAYGIISPRAWRIGKFTPPTVQQIKEGFIVTRWIYTTDTGTEQARTEEGVYRIREWVGRDGAYRRRALERFDKKLPNTAWWFLDNEE